MKSITQKAVSAFKEGRNFKQSNTKVEVLGKTRYLYLFDNLIAIMNDTGLSISNCGWFSNTTKERLNGLPSVSIYQRKGKWYLNGREWNGTMVNVMLFTLNLI